MDTYFLSSAASPPLPPLPLAEGALEADGALLATGAGDEPGTAHFFTPPAELAGVDDATNELNVHTQGEYIRTVKSVILF